MPLRLLLALLLTAAVLSGCGRRGLLEEPPARAEPAAAPTAVQAPAEPAIAPGSGALIDPQAPVAGAPDQRSAGSQNPSPTVSPNASKRRFILDPLI
jgi:predicted small lipoprotein YifL